MEIISPVNDKPFTKVNLLSKDQAEAAIENAKKGALVWRATSIDDRIQIVNKFVDAFIAMKEEIATELTWLIGR